MRADRLLSILLLLQNNTRMTSRELARKLEVSERTIFRDMEALSAAGIPVFAERGSTGGWALSEGYRTNLTGMKKEEVLSLLLVAPTTLLADMDLQKSFDTAFQKLLAASPTTMKRDADYARQRIHVDGAGWHQTNETVDWLPAIQEAVWEDRKLRVQYRRNDEIVERLVHPLGLVAKRSTWYLVAEVDAGFRTYRVSRFVSVHRLEENFKRPVDFDLARYWEQSVLTFKSNLPSYPAKLVIKEASLDRISSERYAKLLHSHPTETAGWHEADIEFQTLESACEIILSFGPQVKVLAPLELRTLVLAEASATVRLYEDN
ncbi:transcriptional regulator [Paenibacillus baekrokdamisoli]|uniref:Transcriptional regulator n=1 Tax=Paenibacillus baekrokdamisoli TaxID=1712516 RepID=A0A3G9JDZ4_9BACL|nr:WYL domain-containing protein [Paenibacillus baekrokdamisoli]MBB3071906.1 putative DNA-binding transcriptional regulator YafY [Paenibacillus baekrokdamisoli]BBH24111.1 transcriptional regulator [Paenibacillus baekrokdamisoli]